MQNSLYLQVVLAMQWLQTNVDQGYPLHDGFII